MIFLLLIFIYTFISSNNFLINNSALLGTSTNLQEIERGVHKVNFFEQTYFNQGIEEVKNSKPFDSFVFGGIVPHDLFPANIIASFFKRLSYQQPNTIILLGPNHYERGDFKALTSFYHWDTPFGKVAPNQEIITTLIDQNLLKVDEKTLPNDHAVAGIIPFIKYFLPDVKVVPILLSNKMSQKDFQTLAGSLTKFVNNKVVLIAAVDFSHYLTNSQAKQKDEQTLKIMQGFDISRLNLLNNDYLDSPPSIGTLLVTMQKLGKTKMNLLFHTNSGELQKNEYIPTTSYFSVSF